MQTQALFRKTIPFLLGAILPLPAGAQEEPLPEVPPRGAGVESLRDSLFNAESLWIPETDAAVPVDEPLSIEPGGTTATKGRWRIEPRLQVTGTYDDNIFIQTRDPIDDFVTMVAPGLAVGFWKSDEQKELFYKYRNGLAVADRSEGSLFALDYMASFLGFADTSSLNTVNHDARFDARWERGKLTFGSNLRFERKLETNVDPGQLITRETISAGITALYELSKKTVASLGLYSRSNRPERFTNTVEWSGEGTIDYAVTSRTQVGVGAAGGLLEVENGFDQTFERFFVQASYLLTNKLEGKVRGGVEFRQGERPGDRSYPIFDVSMRWTPVSGTAVGLEAFRNVNKSIFEPERDFTITGFSLFVEQKLGSRVRLTLDCGYQMAAYTGDARDDTYFFIKPGIYYALGTWGVVGLSYEHRENNSNRENSNFTNDRTVLELALRF